MAIHITYVLTVFGLEMLLLLSTTCLEPLDIHCANVNRKYKRNQMKMALLFVKLNFHEIHVGSRNRFPGLFVCRCVMHKSAKALLIAVA